MMKHVTLLTIVTIMVAMFVAPIALRAEDNAGGVILATYNGGEITLQLLQNKIDKIPPMYKNRYRTTAGQEQILDAMCVEQIFYLEALAMGLDKDPEIIEAIERAQRPVIISAYRDNAFKEDLVITEDEKRNFYEKELDRLYTTKPVYTMHYMRVDSDSTAGVVRRKIEEGVDFIDLQNQYSTSEYARNRGGRVTFAYKHDRYIPGVGKDTLLCEAIATVESDQLVGPIVTDKGYHFFQVLDYSPSRVQTYEEVASDIENRLRPVKESERYFETIEALFEKYGVEFNEDLLESVNLEDITANESIIDEKLAWGDNPELDYTVGDFISAFKSLPPQEAAQTAAPGARKNLLHREVEDNVFYVDAETKHYEDDSVIGWEIEQARRSVLIRKAYNIVVVDAIELSNEMVEQYYNDNIEQYTTKPVRSVQAFVFADEKTAKKQRKKIVKYAGKGQEDKIDKIVEKYSEHQKNNGIIENLNQTAVLPLFGRNEALTNAIWNTEAGGVSEPFLSKYNNEERWIVMRIVEATPAEAAPIDQVRLSIERRLQQQEARAKFDEVSKSLEEKYALQKFPDRLTVDFTAEELFTLAEDAQKKRKYQDAVMYYDQIIDAFQNNRDDYKAMFMKAFLMAEEMNMKPMAIQAFQRVISDFPEGELHESADFMIKSLTGEYDILQEIDEAENGE